jgi:hypothetical protein
MGAAQIVAIFRYRGLFSCLRGRLSVHYGCLPVTPGTFPVALGAAKNLGPENGRTAKILPAAPLLPGQARLFFDNLFPG